MLMPPFTQTFENMSSMALKLASRYMINVVNLKQVKPYGFSQNPNRFHNKKAQCHQRGIMFKISKSLQMSNKTKHTKRHNRHA